MLVVYVKGGPWGGAGVTIYIYICIYICIHILDIVPPQKSLLKPKKAQQQRGKAEKSMKHMVFWKRKIKVQRKRKETGRRAPNQKNRKTSKTKKKQKTRGLMKKGRKPSQQTEKRTIKKTCPPEEG